MSQAVQQFVLEHEPLNGGEEWDEKTFTEVGNFWSTVELIKGKGLDYEYETPEDYEIPGEKEDNESEADSEGDESEADESLDAEVVDMTEDKPTDEDVVEETLEPKTDGNGDVQDAEIVQEQPDKPDRNLSDDPIQWIQDAGNFTYQKNGKTAINKKGLRVLQHWYDIDNPESEVVVGPEETDHEYCRVRAEAKMPDGRTAVAHGSAHLDRGDDSYLLVEMADTRAKSRVLLDITGMGAVAVSELQNEL